MLRLCAGTMDRLLDALGQLSRAIVALTTMIVRYFVSRISNKHERQMEYAKQYLSRFDNHRFMFWSPVVPVGYVTEHLEALEALELVINGEYKSRIGELRVLAGSTTHDARNPFFRTLQILEHMRD